MLVHGLRSIVSGPPLSRDTPLKDAPLLDERCLSYSSRPLEHTCESQTWTVFFSMLLYYVSASALFQAVKTDNMQRPVIGYNIRMPCVLVAVLHNQAGSAYI
jgi:hypothetical protein